MPDRDEVAEAGRALLGRSLGRLARAEYGLLARLLRDDEGIRAMALCRRRGAGPLGSQRLAVATTDRLLLVEKGMVTRRERVEEVPWSAVRSATITPPARLDLDTASGPVALSLVQPPDQLAALADAARGAGREGAYRELAELARTKLGRIAAFGAESLLLKLVDVLADDETVLDLGYAASRPDGLLAVTTERLIHVPSRGVRTGEVHAEPYDALTLVELVGEDTVRFESNWRASVVSGVVPAGRAATLVQRVRARMAPATEENA